MVRYKVRPMKAEDTPQADEIDREAFPTEWPASSYRRELGNRLAHYMVAYEEGGEQTSVAKQAVGSMSSSHTQGLAHRLKRLFIHDRFFGDETPSSIQHIVGMVGFWMMAGEAHLMTIAVRESLRRQGIGELLLISAIDQAIQLGAEVVTLEVRRSNYSAQSLYRKYGFEEAGIRPRYYRDNKEDAVIMTTAILTSASFRAQFQRLKQEHARRAM